METRSYSQEDQSSLNAFSNAFCAANQFKSIFEEAGADVLTIHWNRPDVSPESKMVVLLDKRFIFELNKIAFFLYLGLRNNGLETEAIDMLDQEEIFQRIDFDRLMEIDQTYSLQ